MKKYLLLMISFIYIAHAHESIRVDYFQLHHHFLNVSDELIKTKKLFDSGFFNDIRKDYRTENAWIFRLNFNEFLAYQDPLLLNRKLGWYQCKIKPLGLLFDDKWHILGLDQSEYSSLLSYFDKEHTNCTYIGNNQFYDWVSISDLNKYSYILSMKGNDIVNQHDKEIRIFQDNDEEIVLRYDKNKDIEFLNEQINFLQKKKNDFYHDVKNRPISWLFSGGRSFGNIFSSSYVYTSGLESLNFRVFSSLDLPIEQQNDSLINIKVLKSNKDYQIDVLTIVYDFNVNNIINNSLKKSNQAYLIHLGEEKLYFQVDFNLDDEDLIDNSILYRNLHQRYVSIFSINKINDEDIKIEKISY